MKVYIDSDYKCHVTNDGTFREVEHPFFDGKCDTFIEGYRFVPNGETWMREDGEVFNTEMISPWKPLPQLEEAQRAYEQERLAEYEALIDELYSEVTS